MKIRYIEIVCDTKAEYDELVQQLEDQCIQTVEMGFGYLVNQIQGKRVLSVTPHFDDYLDPELLALLC